MDNKIVLGYWKIRGLGQVARLLLVYTGLQWQDKQYSDQSQWFNKDKENLGLAFPNLPYLIDGSTKITQSTAIYRYIIRKAQHKQLLGKNLEDEGLSENIIAVLLQLRGWITSLFYDKKWEEKKNSVLQKAKVKFNYLSKFVGEKQFALGYPTLSDFIAAQLSYFIQKLYPDQYKAHPYFSRVRNGIENLPSIKKYYENENAIIRPFGSPSYVSIAIQ